MAKRYMTPLKYTDGNGKERRTQLHFELDPIELMDWTMEKPFEANQLLGAIVELKEIEEGESRDLTHDEIRTMLGVVKLLSTISAGRPTEDGDYFIKDPNWVSSYAYRGFREFLMVNPKETQQFLAALLDVETMERFVKTLTDANAKAEVEASEMKANTRGPDSGTSVADKMREKMRLENELRALEQD